MRSKLIQAMIDDIISIETKLKGQPITPDLLDYEIDCIRAKHANAHSADPELYSVLLSHLRGWGEYYSKHREEILNG